MLILPVLGWAELRIPGPLVDMRALARWPILATNAAPILFGFALFASMIGTASYAQALQASGYGFGSSIVVGGLALLPSGLAMLHGDRHRHRHRLRLTPTLINVHTPAGEISATNGLNALFRSVGSSFASALWATIQAASTITLGGNVLAGSRPYRELFVVCTVSAALAAAMALLVPRHATHAAPRRGGA